MHFSVMSGHWGASISDFGWLRIRLVWVIMNVGNTGGIV